MNSLQLISSKKELLFLLLFISLIFIFNIAHEYFKYKDFTKEEIYSGKFQITNIYDKVDFLVLKLQDHQISFYTSISKIYNNERKEDNNAKLNKLDFINIAIITTKVDFIGYLKGFYSKSIYYDTLKKEKNIKTSLFENINNQHQTLALKELFNALFLAIPISKENRMIYTNFGISHLIAISGFHLSILLIIVYSFFYYPYSLIQQKYFPFRNKKFDILLITIFMLIFYLLLTNIVPSLLRAFIMFILGIYFLRSNIKLFSFETLGLTFLLIIAFFPKYLFSISLWFSIIGVFYIFLYIHYFKNFGKVFNFLFFNFWIFLVFNPIVHFFFPNTSYEQLLSPFITLFFTIFYPLELFLHFISYGNLFDEYILYFLNYKMSIYEVITPLWFFISYVFFSLYSIFEKRAFFVLNILLILFNIYMYI